MTDRRATLIRAVVLAAMLAVLALVVVLLVHAATPAGRASHASPITTPTAAYQR